MKPTSIKICIQNWNKWSEEVRFSTIDQAFTKMVDLRISHLKKSFKDILENIVSSENKWLRIIFKSTTMSEFIRRVKTKKRQAKYKHKYVELRDTFFDQEWSQSYKDFLSEEKHNIWKFYKTIGQWAQELIKIRNQIFNASKDMQDVFENSSSFKLYSKEDVSSILGIVDKLKNTHHLTPYNLWDIPKKIHNKEKYDDGELSDISNL